MDEAIVTVITFVVHNHSAEIELELPVRDQKPNLVPRRCLQDINYTCLMKIEVMTGCRA